MFCQTCLFEKESKRHLDMEIIRLKKVEGLQGKREKNMSSLNNSAQVLLPSATPSAMAFKELMNVCSPLC
jgi:hypothetical protein